MGVHRYTLKNGKVRYRARVKSLGRQVTTRVFDRKADAATWEQEQIRRLRLGEWIDPRRGQVPLDTVATDWIESRHAVKRRTREADAADWRLHIQPRFGRFPVASITSAEVSSWLGNLLAAGAASSSATRYLASLRSILAYAIQDGRIRVNAASSVKVPSGGSAKREGQFLTFAQLEQLVKACKGPNADEVLMLGLGGLRWGELAGLQVADRVHVPGCVPVAR